MLQLFLDKDLVCLLNNRQTRSLVLVREVLSNVCVYIYACVYTYECVLCVCHVLIVSESCLLVQCSYSAVFSLQY